MTLINILFIIVMLHLVAGFGYIFYKLEIEGRKKKKNNKEDENNLNAS